PSSDIARQGGRVSTAFSQNVISVGSPPAKSWSMVAWTSTALLSVFVSYLMTFLLGAGGVAFGFMMLAAMATSGPSFSGLILAVFTLVMGGTVLWSLIPRKTLYEINGVRVELSRESRICAEVAALAKALNEKMPDELYLVPVANAAVLERGKKRIMVI